MKPLLLGTIATLLLGALPAFAAIEKYDLTTHGFCKCKIKNFPWKNAKKRVFVACGDMVKFHFDEYLRYANICNALSNSNQSCRFRTNTKEAIAIKIMKRTCDSIGSKVVVKP